MLKREIPSVYINDLLYCVALTYLNHLSSKY